MVFQLGSLQLGVGDWHVGGCMGAVCVFVSCDAGENLHYVGVQFVVM